MNLKVFPDAPALAAHVAQWMTQLALDAPEKFRIALSGGTTPKILYRLLAEEYRERFPWPKVLWFWGDERYVPHDHRDSNFLMAREAMLSRAPIPQENIFPIPVEGPPLHAAALYERTLQQVYGAEKLDPEKPLFDLTLLGLGADGHTASLLPGDRALDETERWVAVVAHGRPEVRVTLTLPAINASARIAFLVTGEDKAPMLKRVEAGTDVPATRVKAREELIWFADKAAVGG